MSDNNKADESLEQPLICNDKDNSNDTSDNNNNKLSMINYKNVERQIRE